MTTTKMFHIDRKNRQLAPIKRLSLAAVEAKETRDLESWLSSVGESVFGRRILWLARQDRASHEDRSDLIGIDDRGNVVVSELKIVDVDENAVTQALVYASTYKSFGKARLTALWAEQSAKETSTPLAKKAASVADAEKQLDEFLAASDDGGESTVSVNDGQNIILVGPSFSARCLAVCDYLMSATDPSRLSIECWSVSVHGDITTPILTIELVFPPPSTRAMIETKREEARQNKYVHDFDRKTTVAKLIKELNGRDLGGRKVFAYPGQGGVYRCRLWLDGWPNDVDVVFVMDRDENWMHIPAVFTLSSLPQNSKQYPADDDDAGGIYLYWQDRSSDTSKLADTLVEVVQAITTITQVKTSGTGAPKLSLFPSLSAILFYPNRATPNRIGQNRPCLARSNERPQLGRGLALPWGRPPCRTPSLAPRGSPAPSAA